MPLVQEKTRKPALTCERKPLVRNKKWVGGISQIIWLSVQKKAGGWDLYNLLMRKREDIVVTY
jgi:hypothetical protein